MATTQEPEQPREPSSPRSSNLNRQQLPRGWQPQGHGKPMSDAQCPTMPDAVAAVASDNQSVWRLAAQT